MVTEAPEDYVQLPIEEWELPPAVLEAVEADVEFDENGIEVTNG